MASRSRLCVDAATATAPLSPSDHEQEHEDEKKQKQTHKPRIWRRMGNTNITGSIKAALHTVPTPNDAKQNKTTRIDLYDVVVYRVDTATPLHAVRQRIAAIKGVSPLSVNLRVDDRRLTAEQKTLEEQGVNYSSVVHAEIAHQGLHPHRAPQVPGSAVLNEMSLTNEDRRLRIYNGVLPVDK